MQKMVKTREKRYNIPMWQEIKNIYHFADALLANLWYGFPSQNLIVIGVTGTDGKTTTTNLIYHILKTAGKTVSMVSTVNAVINGKVYDTGFHVTTPSAWQIQKFLKTASQEAITPCYLVLEVTSHAIDQKRVWGIDFAIGVLTNVSHEHLDYHKTYDRYLTTKMKLLEKSKIGLINRDDDSYKKISNPTGTFGFKFPISNFKLLTYGMSENADITPKKFPFTTNLLGEYNQYNILAAVAVCKQLGLDNEVIKKAIATFTPPTGRQEIVFDKDFTVMVDFAHTPNAFEKLLQAIKKQTTGRIIHVFGSAGKRDASKRPLMGKASATYADIIVLTSEDSRSEKKEKIIEEIESGIMDHALRNNNKTVFKVTDRQEAITAAITMAKKGDFVVITGKGHETSINYGRGEEPWSDQGAVKTALEMRN